MNNLNNIGLTAIGGGVFAYAMTLITEDFYKGLIGIGVGVIIVVGAAILNKKGIPVGKGKK